MSHAGQNVSEHSPDDFKEAVRVGGALATLWQVAAGVQAAGLL